MSAWEKRLWVVAGLLAGAFIGGEMIARLDAIERRLDRAIVIAEATQKQAERMEQRLAPILFGPMPKKEGR